MASAKKRFVGVKMDGAKAIIQSLKNMGTAGELVLAQAAKAGAEIVLQEAKKLVPVRTGKLKESLHMKQSKVRTKKYARSFKELAQYEVGPKYSKVGKAGGVNYGHLVELGHKTATGKRVQGEHEPGRPYLRPAVDKNKRKIAQAMNKIIADAVGRAMR